MDKELKRIIENFISARTDVQLTKLGKWFDGDIDAVHEILALLQSEHVKRGIEW